MHDYSGITKVNYITIKLFHRLFLGPFVFHPGRASVVQYTAPIYVDGMMAVIPFKMFKDQSILIRPFGWQVWLFVLISTTLYILICGFIERIDQGRFNWWKKIDFATRCIFMDSVDHHEIPVAQIHNTILSLTWIWCSFILFTAYAG